MGENISEKISLLLKNDIKVYPEFKPDGRMAVCIYDPRHAVYNKVKHVSEYEYSTRTINEALNKAVTHVHKLITNKK